MNEGYLMIRGYLEAQGVYYPIFLENIDMTDDELFSFCEGKTKEELEEFVNMYV